MELSGFDGKRIAILIRRQQSTRVLRGTATFVRDATYGNLLTIRVENGHPEEGNPELVIAEDRWSGTLLPDDEHGCEYQLQLNDG